MIRVLFKTMFSVVFQMLMDPMGGIVMTNDGNAILREVRQWEGEGEVKRKRILGHGLGVRCCRC